MRKRTRGRCLAALLAAVMLLTLLPMGAFAADTTATLVTDASTLKAGDRVVIAAAANEKTYAAGAFSSKYLSSVETTLDALGSDVTIFTLGGDASGWTLTSDEGQLYTKQAKALNYSASGTGTWTIDIAEDGTATIASTDTSCGRILYNVNSSRFMNYTSATNVSMLLPSIYRVSGGADTDPYPEIDKKYSVYAPVDAPADGDTVLLYNPGNGQAVTSTPLGSYYLTPEAMTVENGVIATESTAAAWTVSVQDGVYTFKQGDKTLTLGENSGKYNLNLTGDGTTGWSLASCSTDNQSWYMYANGVTGSYGNVYLEYYAKYTEFSAYCTSTDRLSEDAFGFVFYKLVRAGVAEPEPVLDDGARVVIYNPASMMALSQTYSGYYNSGVAVTDTDGVLSGYSASEVWTVGVNDDGSYTFSTADGQKLSMGASYSSTPLDDVNTAWTVTEAATADCYYIQNSARGAYLEWYADKSNWSSYSSIGSNEALFAQAFYVVTGDIPTPDTSLPAAGDEVVLYNLSAQGVLAGQDDNTDSPAIENVAAAVADGKATPENGAAVFTVEKNGDYYRFKNETWGYLCSGGTGNTAWYQAEAGEDADWTLAACSGASATAYTMESRTAKYNGKYSQYMEYCAGAYKTYSMYNVTDYDIYAFQFYPIADGVGVTAGVVNAPKAVFGALLDAYVGMDYSLSFTVESVFGVESLAVTVNGAAVEYTETDGVYTVVIPAARVTGTALEIAVTGTDVKGAAITGGTSVAVKDEPYISDVTPAAGSETGDEKQPSISAAITNAGENPTVTMTVGGERVAAVYADGKVSYTPAAAMADGRVTVTVTVTRADGVSASKSWSFTVGEATMQLYFGQLHSHTTYSDGSGSLQSALDYIASLPESANVDFVAFTDHSNYFDSTSNANPEQALYDMSLASESAQKTWSEYKGAVADFNAAHDDIVAIAGFEMTWSGGPGHINTFNTEGFVSRNNATLNNKTSDAGMKAYYALLSQTEGADSLSQFNHPGSTFGTFTDFSYWDATIDSRIFMVEVGNGEGAIGAGGYYPSYEYYTMALDKGWHVAPTNNQDNHKGKWGNANDARDVILTDDFSEDGIYQAIRDMRMYATEDKNLELYYSVNGQLLGSIIEEVPEALNVSVQVSDPDATDSISKVEVIVNSGKTAYTWDDPAQLATGNLTCTLSPDYSYYYIRVTEGDGDLAVTAPVWVGETLKLGISSVESDTATPVTGEELTLTTTLFNSESAAATVKSVTYTTNGGVVLGTDTTGYTIPASGTASVSFAYTPTAAKVTTVTATAVVEQDGVEYTFSMDVTLDVLDAESLVYIGIDASHHNEYVAGNYSDSMGNFGNLAATYSVRTVELDSSEELIAACANEKYKAIVLTAPSRRDGTALRDPYDTYSDAEIAALVAFNAGGGTVILCGWGDYYESYRSFPAADHMAAQQNKLLAALGSSLRISDDETKDNTWNGGQSQRLYLSTYNMESFLLDGVEYDAENPHNNLYTELYSQYGGASIYVVDDDGQPTSAIPATVTPAVYGFDTTYSSDDDGDSYGGLGSVPKYAVGDTENLMVLATEQLEGKGLIVVSGAAFLSNFEVQATVSDSGSEKNYSNYKICENLLALLNPTTVTDIATVQKQTETGYKYTIEGTVTSNASGYDKDTAFFDCIYVQDATGGICCFPVAGEYKIGDRVRITGTTDFYQGEAELQVTSIEKLGEGEPVAAADVTAAQVNDGSVLGSLVTLSGTVQSFELANGLAQTILVQDADGDVARVFIDGYITTAKDVENLAVGARISVTGLASYDNTFNAPEGPFPRIRVRDRADVVCAAADVHRCAAFTDIDMWAKASICAMVEPCYMNGVSDTLFAPNEPTSRAMAVTVLYRMAGAPDVGGLVCPFEDVPAGKWYSDAVTWAANNGIARGVTATLFEPEADVTRAQLAAFVMRYAALRGGDVSARAELSGYTDAGDVPGWALENVQWAVAEGLLIGSTRTTLVPTESATRAQLATVLARYMEM